jgi:hypothetical protein
MGYARYTLADGREAGYAITATCDEGGCKEKIDRGLGYLCGDTPGGDELGCGGYFCAEHLWLSLLVESQQLCRKCMDRALPADEPAQTP